MDGQKFTIQDMHTQTARVKWQELEKHFARGVVIWVDGGLDLVEIATYMANDDKTTIEPLLASKRIEHLATETARDWQSRDPDIWAVVVAPWVVVQERAAG